MSRGRQAVEDDLFTKWDGWIVRLDRLVNQIVLHRHIYQEVRKIVVANPKVAKQNHFYEWLWYMYTTGLAVEIRKLIDRNDQTISVRTLLEAMKRNPQVISRRRYKERFVDDVYEEADADKYLDKLLGEGKQQIEVARIQAEIDELEKKAKKIKDYVDKLVAHTDKEEPTDIPSIQEGDEAIDYIVEIVDLYYPYFQGIDPGDREPNFSYDWTEIFRHPWIS